jgi:trehalose/maltose hydrolase-like predicted phosphorylase
VADDQRRGVLRVLARRHRGVPHQRGHRRRRHPVPRRRPRRRLRRETGLELLVQTARLWRSLGHLDRNGRWHVSGVTGPDEYSAVADDNVYTNLMAQRNLRAASIAARKHADRAVELGVTAEEIESWRTCADAVYLPYDEVLGVHQQSEGFHRVRAWDFENTPAKTFPLLLHYPYFDLYRKQVVKQADLVWRCSCAATRSRPRRRPATSPTTRR